jgi:hypothetical protein
MKRFREMEKLQETVRAELPGVAVAWLAALRQPLEELTMAALNGKVGDEEFLKRVEDFAEKIPGLLEEMDSAALAGLMEGAMGAAMANGIAARVRRPEAGDWKEAGLPWEPEALLGARRGGKGVFPGELRLKTFKMLDPRDILRKKNEDSGG